MLRSLTLRLLSVVALSTVSLAHATEPPAATAVTIPNSEASTTEGTVTIDGKAVGYTATAGTLVVRDGKDQPAASLGYFAYTRKGVADVGTRPITFAWNGGPGSSSIWLHMGALGPRRAPTVDAGATPPPYKVVDNPWSVIDKTDLVMVDPVGTGLSRAVGERKDKDFWGVDADIESISRFIRQFVTENGRWRSPKFLLGESYGSTRAGGIAEYLETRENLSLNGVILVSVALDIESIFAWPGNDRPYPFLLPTFAAVAAFHGALPQAPAPLEPFLDEVRAFAIGEYRMALDRGDRLPAAERAALAAKLHRYTGLSADYWQRANLRVREAEFAQELLRDQREIVGRLDGRFRGFHFDSLSQEADYDPQSSGISAAFTAAFLDYLERELRFGRGQTYRVINHEAAPSWDWKHNVGWFIAAPTPNTAVDLGRAMTRNPHLHLLVQNGLHDLATPFFATEWTIDHLGIPPERHANIVMKYYPSGHMMYLDDQGLAQFKLDIAQFIDRALGVTSPEKTGR